LARRPTKGLNGFKSTTGSYLTQALFFEHNLYEDREGVLYTLKNHDHMGYPSLKRLYFEIDDPTEYEVATTLFDGWEHWQRLCELAWFKPFVESWRDEMLVKRASQGLKEVIHQVEAGGKGSLVAAKYLISQGWVSKASPDKRPKAGRPRKKEVAEAAGLTPEIQADFDRMKLN
jgi:hypothetical protein